ncbi:hypothetical protein ACIBI4_01110 [Streptomyces sp. NPDC050418]|uniref:hypothetical protein n=1 Tax=Streptomyces sp. NPDC050418 TaxID=3365612 RepID=UPI0037A78F12
MGRSAPDLGSLAVGIAVRPPLLLTSRRHIDLLRVCSAAPSPRESGPDSARD